MPSCRVKLSPQRKAYIGVLGLGLAALIVDRGFLSGSGTSPASAAAGLAPETVPGASLAQAPEAASTTTVAERLDALRDRAAPASAPDAFAVVESWYESASKPGTAATGNASAVAYHLSSVLTDKQGKPLFAVVNGQKIALSQEVDGVKLIDASGAKGGDPASAVIEVGGELLTLRMKEPATRSQTLVQARKETPSSK